MVSNVHLSNEPMLTNVSLSIEPKPIIGQTEPSAKFWFESQPEQIKDLVDFWFKSAAYMDDLYDFSKEFNIGDLYRDRIVLMNHIRAYAAVNKFNLVHILSNEYKIVRRICLYQLTMTSASILTTDGNQWFSLQRHHDDLELLAELKDHLPYGLKLVRAEAYLFVPVDYDLSIHFNHGWKPVVFFAEFVAMQEPI
ncbi:hypothetical protein GIB67_014112 [Kingdonia uniflora]|uniref:Uncharacterized protein n=1 Tax=Kingdonia uniflora TaxID=39325 RepID=A0A7J7N4F3_9MAGN|nr:hypothetical protein GIB67_014112 [Kingdonia uniflora]